jgi:CheY-like chemotaxis protein
MAPVPPTPTPWLALVDDDRELQDFMRQLLALCGWGLVPITGASVALEQIVTAQPDAILLDLHLQSPESGWVVLEALAADARTCHIPVIVWSADMRELEAKHAWLHDRGIPVLPKPFEIDEVASLLDGLNPYSSATTLARSS